MLEITCPSGLRGVLRGMKVKDEQLFTNKKLVRSGAVIAHLLAACWEKTLDPGPYVGDKLDWDKVLATDRTHAMIQLRIASYGDQYDFAVTCGSCGKHFGWSILLSELPVLPASSGAIEYVRSGTPVPLTIGENKLLCRPLCGADERELQAALSDDQTKAVILNLAKRVMDFNGETNAFKIRELLEDMAAADADALWDATETMDGGVDTYFDVECPQCGMLIRMSLPFGPGFFSSRKRFAPPQRSNG